MIFSVSGLTRSRSRVISENFENEITKFGVASNAAMIIASGNIHDIGVIRSTNTEISRLLGYSIHEIIGQNISRILPKVLADLHDDLMKRYFDTSQNSVLGFERLVFPVDCNGYLVPCLLMVIILPTLEEGVQCIGFMKDYEYTHDRFELGIDEGVKPHFIMFGKGGVIHGITYNIRQEFGVPASLCWGNNNFHTDFTIDVVFPELNIDNMDALKSKNGAVVTFDTTKIPTDFVINKTEEEEEFGYE